MMRMTIRARYYTMAIWEPATGTSPQQPAPARALQVDKRAIFFGVRCCRLFPNGVGELLLDALGDELTDTALESPGSNPPSPVTRHSEVGGGGLLPPMSGNEIWTPMV